jgi:LCP family protein required for cell wall assembly
MRNQRYSALIVLVVGLAFLCTASLIGYFGFQAGRDVGLRGDNIIDSLLAVDGTPRAEGDVGDTIPESPDFARPTAIPWDGATRVTMLVMGLDYRDFQSNSDASRSDTMILLTIDPVTKSAGILSVPRDLWAYIPGFKPYKINTAYYFGELYNLPGGGPALAMATVEQTIGVEIDYYAVIDFAAFENFIDLIGGVKVEVKEPIRLDPLGPKPPRTVQPGTHVLPGYLALAYARNRSTGDGDFGRAERQQQVILGIRDRLLGPELFDYLVVNAAEIYNELKGGINTNLSLEDAIKLGFLAVQVPDGAIQRGVINEQYVTFGRSPDDLAILIPIPDKIRQLRDEIFTGQSVFSPLTPGSAQERAALEGATLVVLNGSGVSGLDTRTANYLASLGVPASAGGATNQTNSSAVTDHAGKPFTIAWLAQLVRIGQNQILHDFNPNAGVEVTLIVGNDWANNNPMP